MFRLLPRAVVCLVGLGALGSPAAAQLPNQAFEVLPEVTHATVGDSVSLRFRVRLDERDLLYDTVPKPIGDLPPGVRVLAVEKLRRGADRIYTGRAQVAFYRTGRVATPIFSLPFMRAVKGVTRADLSSDSAFVTIDPVAPPGNPQLKDIRDITRRRGPDPLVVAGVLGAVAAALVLLLLGRRMRVAPPLAPAAADPVAARGPYEAALARLDELEQAARTDAGESPVHYEAIANVVRDYLERVDAAPARRRTTEELLVSLPAPLFTDRLREECGAFFSEADLVKFARARRDGAAAVGFAGRARRILTAWHKQTSR